MKDALSGVAFLPFPNELGQNPVKRWMEDIQAEIQTPSPGYYSNVQGLFTQLFVHIFRTICRKTGTGTEPAQSLPRKLNDELRSRIVDLFFKDFCEPLRIEMLADKLNLSVKQVSRMMQQEYRSTFKQKLIDTRVEAAKHLLRVGELTIQRIAEEVGYANPDNFTRMFIKKTGMTPSRYRVVHCRPNKSSLM
jgi:AraC-like DNA-binding protein